ncbi:MAG: DUF1080 domain-containing protein [Verrucomicrobia bacterium]|nr:DUF1080 domain-containing protein [Verrucomicrobiota bacterium]
MRTLLFLIVTTELCVMATAEPLKDYTSLFDGKTLTGWTALPGGEWSVDQGEIFGRQDKSEGRHGQLISDKQYRNFILQLDYKALAGNSGVYFRVQKTDNAVAVKGFQAEVDADGNHVAGLYETQGRAWVFQPDPQKIKSVYKPKEWNHMTIIAMEGNITVSLNDVVMTTLVDDPGLREGYIALQLHGGQDMDVRYRDIQIREFPSGN